MISSELQNGDNSCNSTIDQLADRVQSILGKTITLEKTQIKFSTASIRLSDQKHNKVENVLNGTPEKCRPKNNQESLLDSFKNPEPKSDLMLFEKPLSLNQSISACPSITEFLMNNNEYDDLTEYYPIEKKVYSNPLKHLLENETTLSSSNKTNESSTMSVVPSKHKLSDIIMFHKKFLNSQINHLKKLNNDLMRIEKCLLKSNQMPKPCDMKKLNSLIDCYSNQRYDCKKIMGSISNLTNDHCPNKCCQGNKRVSDEHRQMANLNYESLLFKAKQPTNKNCCYDNIKRNKQDQILKTSIEMIQKIDSLLNAYEMDVTDKSIQTSLIQTINYKEQTNYQINDNLSNDNQRKPISWFLNFEGKQNYYKIEPQFNSLQELFERNCVDFKMRSQMRARRIKDNSKLRIETADRRKEEIVQVFLLKQTCPQDQIIRKKSAQTKMVNYRPLSPTTRRVFTHREMRTQTEKLYQRLPEFKAKLNCGKREDEAKRRRMMADIFKQKLKDNAVRGKLNWPITSQAICT